MTKILVDLSDEEDKAVEIYKLVNNLKTKEAAIKQMVLFFKVKIKPENMSDKEYQYKKSINFGGKE
jgi:hypothetical protein